MYALEIELSPLVRAVPGERVVALDFIPPSTLLASISTTALLSLKTTSFPPQHLDTLSNYPPPLTLALVLLHESILPHSPWSTYIRSLPSHAVPIATLWPSEARRWIQGTQLATLLDSLPDYNEMLSTFFDEHVTPLIAQIHPRHPPPSLASFRYFYSLSSSRGFTVSAYHGLALCPFADMLDHANPISENHAGPYNNVDFRSDYWVCSTCGMVDNCEHDDDLIQVNSKDDSTSSCDIVSILPILAGEEVFNNYGRLDNSSLLAHYGFALEDNEVDRIVFDRNDILAEFEVAERWENEEIQEQADELLKLYKVEIKKSGDSELVMDDRELPWLFAWDTSTESFIDSDARISRPLWIILALVTTPSYRTEPLSTVCASLLELDAHQTTTFEGAESIASSTIQESSRNLAAAVRRVCRRRIEASHRSELSVDEILSLAQAEQSIEVKLAMTFLASERTRLECVESLFSSLIV